MKKIISTILIMAFLFPIFMTAGFARTTNNRGKEIIPPGLAKKEFNLPRGIAKKIFDDIDGIQWAKEAIELMQLKGLIRGYGEGRFAPNNAVTKLETVIMALRVMGWEKETQYIRQLPHKYRGGEIGDWAKGYVAVAYEKGILDDVDMMYFKPNDPAKRYEVAKYVIRALGYEREAQRSMDERLPFVDAELVPQGAVGYVYLVNDMKLMQGDNNRAFNPMGTLTRAEMAVLFHRLDQKVDSDIDENEYRGIISRISDEEITLSINNRSKSFEVAYDVVVYDSEGRVNYSYLSRGIEVIITVIDDEVVSIKIVDETDDGKDKIISNYKGEVIDINIRAKEITIQVESMKVTFIPADNVRVYFKEELGDFNEIMVGDNVKVIVDTRNRAREIYIDRKRVIETQDRFDVISGVIRNIYRNSIEVMVGKRIREYEYADTMEILVGRDDGSLRDLEEGMTVDLKVLDNVVYVIYVVED